MANIKNTRRAGRKVSGRQGTKAAEAKKRQNLAAITFRNATESPLLSLPPELRCMIWDYVFYDTHLNVRRRKDPKPLFPKPTMLSILQVCKQLNTEIGVLPYSLCSISGLYYDVCYLVGFQLSDVKLSCITSLRISAPNSFLIPFHGPVTLMNLTTMGVSLTKLVSMPKLDRIVVSESNIDNYGLNCFGSMNMCMIVHAVAAFARVYNPSLRIEELEEGTLFSSLENVSLFRNPVSNVRSTATASASV